MPTKRTVLDLFSRDELVAAGASSHHTRASVWRLVAIAGLPVMCLALTGPGCRADALLQCNPGETRDCGMCPWLCSYQGCGMCVGLAVAISGFETCMDDGTWGRCNCLADVEPECTAEPTADCAQQCSYTLSALTGSSSEPPSAACRSAYVELLACSGEGCGWIGAAEGCSAELATLDQACLGAAAPPVCAP